MAQIKIPIQIKIMFHHITHLWNKILRILIHIRIIGKIFKFIRRSTNHPTIQISNINNNDEIITHKITTLPYNPNTDALSPTQYKLIVDAHTYAHPNTKYHSQHQHQHFTFKPTHAPKQRIHNNHFITQAILIAKKIDEHQNWKTILKNFECYAILEWHDYMMYQANHKLGRSTESFLEFRKQNNHMWKIHFRSAFNTWYELVSLESESLTPAWYDSLIQVGWDRQIKILNNIIDKPLQINITKN